jgi:prophage regulatory protein
MRNQSATTGPAVSNSLERPGDNLNCGVVGFAVLPKSGLVRLASIIGPSGPIPVSKSTWWAGVKCGRYPKPVKLGPRITAWRVEDIRALIDIGLVE